METTQTIQMPKAMLLAAGFGSRLRPLTDWVPKPLIPLANRPLIEYVLAWLQKSNVEQVAVNIHHLGRQIQSLVGNGSGYGLSVSYSVEQPILGTGGGLVRLRSFFDQAAFFVVNADVLVDVDLSRLLTYHRQRAASATMVVKPYPEGSSYTRLMMDEEGWLVEFKSARQKARGSLRPVMFCGVHVIEPEIFDFLPRSGFSCLNSQGYHAMLESGRKVAAYLEEGPWFDLGTPADYLQTTRAFLTGQTGLSKLPGPVGADAQGVLIGKQVQMGEGVSMGPEVVVGDESILGDKVRLARSIVWPKTVVQPGTDLDMTIAAPGCLVRA